MPGWDLTYFSGLALNSPDPLSGGSTANSVNAVGDGSSPFAFSILLSQDHFECSDDQISPSL